MNHSKMKLSRQRSMWARSERDEKKSVNPALAPLDGEAAADESRSACGKGVSFRLRLFVWRSLLKSGGRKNGNR